MPALKRFIQVVIAVLTLGSLMVLPLAATVAQGSVEGTPPPPERLPPREHDGRGSEARPWGPEPVGRVETAQPTSLLWHIETVEGEQDVGWYTSLALDSAGQPHISYYGNFALKYAHFDGTAWQTETVDSGLGSEAYTSLALDASGNPHISYHISSYSDLKYTHFDGTAWRITTIDSAGDVGQYTSLALDASGQPHISYRDHTNYEGDLKYARFDGLSWQVQTVDSAGDVGYYTSLALDAAGRPHISYLGNFYGNFALKYAHFDGTAWQIETVDIPGAGFSTSLALDAADQPHISYYEYDGSLKYVYLDGGAWQFETVDSNGTIWAGTSLELDASDNPHISYQAGGLKYAHFDGTSWSSETVDSAGNVGQWSSLALDSYDLPHISYHAITHLDLKYAYLQCVPPSSVSISGPTSLPTGVNGTYTASYLPVSATLPITLTWDNGTISTTAIYSWTMEGTYTISVTGTNDCGQASGAFTVTVCDLVVILSASTAISGCLVDFHGELTGSAPFTYDWDFGPFGSSSAPTPTIDFYADGTYAYTLTAFNCGGAFFDTFASEVTVRCGISCAPVTNTQFTWIPLTPTVGQAVTFTASAAGTPPITFSWAFGDGTTGAGAVVAHTYAITGTYSVTLTATNCLTATETIVQTIVVVPAVPPPEYRIYLPLVLRGY